MVNNKLIVGIDEAGRGPLAGPVTLAAFGTDKKMEKWLLKNIFENKLRDSKKLSPNQRWTIYRALSKLKRDKKLNFAVSHISNKIIDKEGISCAIKLGVEKCLKNFSTDWSLFRGRGFLDNHRTFIILLDGSLKAPKEFKNQKTIIKGDEKNVFIACASIIAKVFRDRLMCRLAKKYPNYDLEIHRGYGTKLHYKKIKKYGISKIHRKSFLSNLKI